MRTLGILIFCFIFGISFCQAQSLQQAAQQNRAAVAKKQKEESYKLSLKDLTTLMGGGAAWSIGLLMNKGYVPANSGNYERQWKEFDGVTYKILWHNTTIDEGLGHWCHEYQNDSIEISQNIRAFYATRDKSHINKLKREVTNGCFRKIQPNEMFFSRMKGFEDAYRNDTYEIHFIKDKNVYNQKETYGIWILNHKWVKERQIEQELRAEQERFAKEREEQQRRYLAERNTLYNQYAKYFPNKSDFEKLYDEIDKEQMQIKAEETKQSYYAERDRIYMKFVEYYPVKSDFEKQYDKIGKEKMLIEAEKKHQYWLKREDIYRLYSAYYPHKQEFDRLYEKYPEMKQKLTSSELSLIKTNVNTKNIDTYKKIEFLYPILVSYIIRTNKAFSDRWEKESQFFSNQIEFYEAYSSEAYKSILKQKKKEKKEKKMQKNPQKAGKNKGLAWKIPMTVVTLPLIIYPPLYSGVLDLLFDL